MRYASSNITTAVMFGFTVYLMVVRFRTRRDWNLPLIYYLFVVAYHQAFPERLLAYAIYTGVVIALVIRFEFLPKKLEGVLRFLDISILTFLAYSFLTLVTK
ncbi:MAG: hypothetical protein FJW20_11105 [Acidimicrobiia bacterium]|nr:hypothetical protein [Acidimicrobiia bacterium]